MYEIYCKLRDLKKYKDADVSKATGITKSTFTDWKNGRSTPKLDKLQKIADFLGVTVEYLTTGKKPEHRLIPEDAVPIDFLSLARLPILGSSRCGKPMFAESNIEGYEYAFVENCEDCFYLRAKGDSMIGAGINEGDLLLIRKQSDVDSGDIAIINIDEDEETLKRVIKKDKTVVLKPENPAYETKIFIGKDLNALQIQGRLMQVIKKY
ncbi:LexA repressor [bioreactor metagenome]|uniref:LexA repressor n=1 Tax=bioreactor metagenome TaxID=1076179 RepID=A0A645G0W0_9ZZZZ